MDKTVDGSVAVEANGDLVGKTEGESRVGKAVHTYTALMRHGNSALSNRCKLSQIIRGKEARCTDRRFCTGHFCTDTSVLGHFCTGHF